MSDKRNGSEVLKGLRSDHGDAWWTTPAWNAYAEAMAGPGSEGIKAEKHLGLGYSREICTLLSWAKPVAAKSVHECGIVFDTVQPTKEEYDALVAVNRVRRISKLRAAYVAQDAQMEALKAAAKPEPAPATQEELVFIGVGDDVARALVSIGKLAEHLVEQDPAPDGTPRTRVEALVRGLFATASAVRVMRHRYEEGE